MQLISNFGVFISNLFVWVQIQRLSIYDVRVSYSCMWPSILVKKGPRTAIQPLMPSPITPISCKRGNGHPRIRRGTNRQGLLNQYCIVWMVRIAEKTRTASFFFLICAACRFFNMTHKASQNNLSTHIHLKQTQCCAVVDCKKKNPITNFVSSERSHEHRQVSTNRSLLRHKSNSVWDCCQRSRRRRCSSF